MHAYVHDNFKFKKFDAATVLVVSLSNIPDTITKETQTLRGKYKFLNLHGHDLRLFWSCLSRFKLSLPQCNVPVVFNGMSGRLSGFPSSY